MATLGKEVIKYQNSAGTWVTLLDMNALETRLKTMEDSISSLSATTTSLYTAATPVTLFNVSTTDAVASVTLSDSLANYARVDISFISGAGVISSTTIYEPEGKSINISINEKRDNSWYSYGSNKIMSGASITPLANCDGAAFSNVGSTSVNIKSDFFVKIFKVVGYKALT